MRDLTPADEAGLAALLGDADHPGYDLSGARLHGPPLDGNGRWRRTLVAVAGDRVVGAVTAARWRLHPDRMLSAVHVAPDHRRRGLARDLLDCIRHVAERRPLAGRLRAGDGPDEAAGTAVVAATLAVCLHTLANAGVTTTLLDGHDTDTYLAPVTRTLPPGHADPVHLVEIPPIV